MKKLALIYFLAAAVLFGCDDWLDVNTDPNNPVEVTPDLVLPVAQLYSAKIMQEDRGVNHLGNMMMYNWSESGGYSWYNDEFLYLCNSTFYDQIFDRTFERALKQYADLLDLPAEYGAYTGIAKIMNAYHFQLLVDFYGDVPYSEALQRGLNPNPAYDDAAIVYDSLLGDIDEAIALFNAETSTEIPADDDAIFGGDLDAWKQFGNSIKLRILTRLVDVKDAAFINAQLATIASEGSGYITASAGVNPGYVAETGQQSPFWESFGQDVAGNNTQTNNATCASDFILTYLEDTGDRRLPQLFEEPASGHRGVPQGITSDPVADAFGMVSNIGPGLLTGADQDAILMSLPEVYFNQAELALKGFGGDAEALYTSGVNASYALLGIPDSAASYLAQPSASYPTAGSDAQKLEAIITQKWLGVMGVTAEQSWFDWVRTGYPSGIPVSQEQPGLVRPVRLHYPASEIGTNGANLPTQPDPFTASLFWAN